MGYYIDLFSPETYETFTKSDQTVSGFRQRQENVAGRVQPGDKLLCYMTKLGRWVGVLEVTSSYFRDTSPLFYESNDPFEIRFNVRPLSWLPVDRAVPIRDDAVWQRLSFTRNLEKNSSVWTGKFRASLNAVDDEDGRFLEQLLIAQQYEGREYPYDRREYERFLQHKVRLGDREISVAVPQDTETPTAPRLEVRESLRIQRLLAEIGAQMGMRIWLPRNDRAAVMSEWKPEAGTLLDNLPLNYDETTIRTIEQIDVIWLKRRSIVRAFEVEHTTSIYSGILRMADLLALQPNMNIKLHIVAPFARREKVFQELRRPVFSLLEAGPLFERCSYLSYDSVEQIGQLRHLAHLSDGVLDEYADEAD